MDPEDLVYFNPFTETKKTSNFLPHWQQPGAVYFITFRLADAVPTTLRQQWKEEREIWLQHHPPPWTPAEEEEYQKRFTARIEHWLDAGHGSCVLRKSSLRAIVEECLQYFDGQRYSHHAWVIMPNHVHVLVTLSEGRTLEKVLHTWKSFTANRIQQAVGATGTLWQEDYFDRLIRDGGHFDTCVRYIRGNPERARLKDGEFTLYESAMVRTSVPRG
jgi:putative transposase